MRHLGSPRFVFWVNVMVLVLLVPWTALLAVPSSPLFTLGKEVWYVTFISHVALILSAWSTAQSASVAMRQDREQGERARHDEELERKLDDLNNDEDPDTL